jgi:uncharacterized phiE125 gp8 family phage protein
MLTGNSTILKPNFKLVTAPTTEPCTVSDFQAHSLTPVGQDEAKIEAFLKTARLNAEQFTGRAFITQAWKAAFDLMDAAPDVFSDYWYESTPRGPCIVIPKVIELQRPPLLTVSSIVTYADDAVHTATTMSASNYYVSTNGLYGRIMLRTGYTWPTGLRPLDSIIITYTCGYGPDATAVPQDIKEAIIEWAAHAYENKEGQPAANAGGAVVLNRGAFIPSNVQTKLAAYRLPQL